MLVTGASGLVGSSILRNLSSKFDAVVGISSKDLNLLDKPSTFSFIQDLKPKVIIAAAAKVGGIGGNSKFPVDYLSENLQMQANLFEAANAANVQKLVFFGSSCIYPRNSEQPIKEEYLLTGPLEVTNSAYAIAKIAGLELINAYRKQFDRKWFSVMPTNLYGPNDNFDLETSHVLPALIRKIVDAKLSGSAEVILWGTGNPLREFLHVDDLASAIGTCLEKYEESQHINIGSAQEISIRDLARKIATKVGFFGNIVWDQSKPDGTPRKLLDSSKIRRLGWEPKIPLDIGIDSTIDWYQNTKIGESSS